MPIQSYRFRNIATALSAWMVLSLTTPVFAVDILDDPVQIEERVGQLIHASNSLCWEMYRYHQQQPSFRDSYQSAKDLWSQATRLRNALWSGPVETDAVIQQVTDMNETFLRVERSLAKWGDGDRSSLPMSSGPVVRTVVTPGVDVDVPFFNLQVGGASQVEVLDDTQPQMQRRRLHPNSHGSKRSLERELVNVKLALSYLMEDSGIPASGGSSAGIDSTSAGQAAAPKPDPSLTQPETVVPARQPDNTSDRK